MGVCALQLLIGKYLGPSKKNPGFGDFKWTPSRDGQWMTIFWAGSVGGAKRAFSFGNVIPPAKDQHVIVNEMEVGDEMRQIIQQGTLSVWRYSDQYSLEILDLANPRTALAAYLNVMMDSGGKTLSSATLTMQNARLGGHGRAVKGGKNIEGFTLRFNSQNAKVEYGDRSRSTLIQDAVGQLAKWGD